MNKKSKPKPPWPNYVSYFSLCQEIGMQVEEIGRGIIRSGVHAALFHQDMVRDLEYLRGFCDRAIIVIHKAQQDALCGSKVRPPTPSNAERGEKGDGA